MDWTHRGQKGIFAGKDKITRKELIRVLKEDRGFVPGFIGSNLRRKERMNLAPEVFEPKKYPEEIKAWQFKKEVSRLRSRMDKTQDEKSRETLEKKVKYLKKIGGI